MFCCIIKNKTCLYFYQISIYRDLSEVSAEQVLWKRNLSLRWIWRESWKRGRNLIKTCKMRLFGKQVDLPGFLFSSELNSRPPILWWPDNFVESRISGDEVQTRLLPYVGLRGKKINKNQKRFGQGKLKQLFFCGELW